MQGLRTKTLLHSRPVRTRTLSLIFVIALVSGGKDKAEHFGLGLDLDDCVSFDIITAWPQRRQLNADRVYYCFLQEEQISAISVTGGRCDDRRAVTSCTD